MTSVSARKEATPSSSTGLLLVLSLVGSAIGLFWIPRLPRARDIEEPPVIVGGAPQTLR